MRLADFHLGLLILVGFLKQDVNFVVELADEDKQDAQTDKTDGNAKFDHGPSSFSNSVGFKRRAALDVKRMLREARLRLAETIDRWPL